MNVVIEEKAEKEHAVRLGDLFMENNDNSLYLAVRSGDKFSLVGFDGNYWGVWDSIEEFKTDIAILLKRNDFKQYSQSEYELELKRK